MILFVPFNVCFVDDITDLQYWFDNLVDFSFFVDIVLAFFTAILKDGDGYITNHKIIAVMYLKSWFLLDVITTIPFQLILSDDA